MRRAPAFPDGPKYLFAVPEVVIITHLLCHIILLSVGVTIGGEEGRTSLYLGVRLLVRGAAEDSVGLLPLAGRELAGAERRLWHHCRHKAR